MSSWTFLKTSLDAKNVEFQRVHRLGKPKNDSGDGGRTIIARFLRFSDKERVFKQGRKLTGTVYRMFEDIPNELHQKRKAQMERLKEARKEGRRANFRDKYERNKYELSIDQLPVGLIAQLVRALHRYRRGRGFDSRSSLNFFRFLLFNRLG